MGKQKRGIRTGSLKFSNYRHYSEAPEVEEEDNMQG